LGVEEVYHFRPCCQKRCHSLLVTMQRGNDQGAGFLLAYGAEALADSVVLQPIVSLALACTVQCSLVAPAASQFAASFL